MMMQVAFLWFGATLVLLLGGYLFGARRGREARQGLLAEIQSLSALHSQLQTAAAQLQSEQNKRQEAEQLLAESEKRQNVSLRRTREVLLELERERGASTALTARLLEAEKSQRTAFEELLGPLLERERLGQVLSRAESSVDSRGELPRLLEAIALKAGFSSMLLSDEVGLPLAVAGDTQPADTLAASSALLLTWIDRIAASGSPVPVSAVFKDQSNRMTLHRVFRAGLERYVLTAVTLTGFLPPDLLDPALPQLDRLLQRETWA